MKLERIRPEQFDYFYSLLEQDFCWEERNSRENELKAFSSDYFFPCFIFEDDNMIGYFCFWEFDNFVFGEHLAILREIRDQLNGTNFCRWFLDKIKKPLIIEVERPVDFNSRRRIDFYKRLGFVVNDFDYMQPPYHQGDDGVPMLLLSYKKKLTNSQILEFLSVTQKEVYNVGRN